ncbi:MAG: M48 family metallopeptidase [candidate division WOR-3 bacterium]|nr:M48 family metallopeptidase [candidate division WOR-3 bacterium]
MVNDYQIFYRKIKHPRLEFKTGKLHLILPENTSPEFFLVKYKNWIERKQALINDMLLKSKDKKLVNRSDDEFKKLIYDLLKINTQYYNVKINKVFFRKMRTKWASLSHNKNLTLNTLLRYLPKYLINYIINHELAHTIEKKHNNNFWRIISKRFDNYNILEEELFKFWFLLQKHISTIK